MLRTIIKKEFLEKILTLRFFCGVSFEYWINYNQRTCAFKQLCTRTD